MKKFLVSLVLACSVAGVQANTNVQTQPFVVNTPQAVSGERTLAPGYCQIDIVNNSYDLVSIYGSGDDGAAMPSFYLSPGYHQLISLFYATYPGQEPYCHAGMFLSIVRTSDNYMLYNLYTNVQATVYIQPSPYLKDGRSEPTVLVK